MSFSTVTSPPRILPPPLTRLYLLLTALRLGSVVRRRPRSRRHHRPRVKVRPRIKVKVYVTIFQRPTCTTCSPDSPTSRVMMKRLLAKPAPYSGSESNGRSVGVVKRAATIAGNGKMGRARGVQGGVRAGLKEGLMRRHGVQPLW
ncbi:uncharacterized protein LACBIDRAFT_312989 [Laccaria bicolor S238N-H82]|uniref:Predicted protein n=1 Tax=Laccaria bicolor (strain S238N-H82 / ATCC MYA-4686) TaxID=486041 RepID=B0DXA7_LACBS|nr:uncharacterized protein LACBIDRAFT_312989 [Laccaria bicolor S238N-H82]EDR00761.1 predicted protein [Laccaria bicolor S238N-H82]|eukprot:XP_001888553.1 predicted protein [Laccaria bicolor S238N-H82]